VSNTRRPGLEILNKQSRDLTDPRPQLNDTMASSCVVAAMAMAFAAADPPVCSLNGEM